MHRRHGALRRISSRESRPPRLAAATEAASGPVVDPLDEFKRRGLTVGQNFNMLSGVSLDPDHCWHITIGDNVTLAAGVRILAHDASMAMHLGYARIGKVQIGDRVFIGASSIVLPGVRIGNDVVIGAGSVVTRSIPDNAVACGNPAKVIAAADEWLDGKRREMAEVPCFGEEYTMRRSVSEAKRAEMNDHMTDGIGYVG